MRRYRAFDDVLADPVAFRALALAQPFADIPLVAGTFHGIAPSPTTELVDWFVANMPMVTKRRPVLTFLRLSPAGQPMPHYVHTDRDMGAVTGILFLNPLPAPGDGTTFWRHKATGATVSRDLDAAGLALERLEWLDPEHWEAIETAEAKFNRLILFPAECFHSRALFDSYGDGPDEARLTQVAFLGNPEV